MKKNISYRLLKPLTTTLLALVLVTLSACSQGGRTARRQPVDSSVLFTDKAFTDLTAETLKSPWREGNTIQTLVNGDAFYPSMIYEIKAAKKTITFETFAFVEGNAARAFIEALTERAKAGVKVHMILDAVGSQLIGEANIKTLRDAGIELRLYHPISILHPIESNIRGHRKIMVVDGKIGFTGGSGVGDAWMGNAQSAYNWRETHYRVTGPIVADLQRGFNINWIKTGGPKLDGPDYFPVLKPTGNTKAQAFDAAPQDKICTIPHLYRQALASAQKSVIIENSYIVMDKPLMKAVLDARARGVHVEMITSSEHCDSWTVRYLSVFQYHKLLKAGVHIYEYQPSMMHCKVLVVDGIFSSIGSANLDPRSLYINDESNVNVLDAEFAKNQLMVIDRDRKRSKRILSARHPWHPADLPMRIFLRPARSQM